MSRVVIVGGGIAGLAAAYELAEHPEAEVVLLEAGPRLGGKIETQPFAGLPVELGPDTFLARVPWAVDLCKELGLFDELVSPDQTTAYLWVRGALRRLPEAHVLGVPTDFDQLAARGLVSPEAVETPRPAATPQAAPGACERVGGGAHEVVLVFSLTAHTTRVGDAAESMPVDGDGREIAFVIAPGPAA